MSEEQCKKQEAKQDPTKAEQVKDELIEEIVENIDVRFYENTVSGTAPPFWISLSNHNFEVIFNQRATSDD